MKLETRTQRIEQAIMLAGRSIDALRLSLRHKEDMGSRGRLEQIAAADLQVALNLASSANGWAG